MGARRVRSADVLHRESANAGSPEFAVLPRAVFDAPPPPGFEWYELLALLVLCGAVFGGFVYYFVSARSRDDSLPRRFGRWMKLVWDTFTWL